MRISIISIVYSLTLVGCLSFSGKMTDVTQNPKYWGGYQPGSIYQLEQAMFLEGREIKKYSLTPERYYDRFDTKDELQEHNIFFPGTVNEYTKSPQKYPDFAVVLRGVNLKCTKIMHNENSVYTDIAIYGVILDGGFQNIEVYLNHISMPADYSSPAATFFLAPDPKYLKKVNSAEWRN